MIHSKYDILDYLNEFIAGQDDFKNSLANLGYLYDIKMSALKSGIRLESTPRLNLFISGESGSGKTYGVLRLSEAMRLPFTRIDCSNIVAHGWHGVEIADHFIEFLEKHPDGLGIIFLDEFDKVSSEYDRGNSGARDGKRAIQTAMLDLLDGQFKQRSEKKPDYDISNINNALFILGGSFQEIRENLRRYDEEENDFKSNLNRAIGFLSNLEVDKNQKSNKKEAELDKLIKNGLLSKRNWKEGLILLGFVPELVNRLVDFAHTKQMKKKEIKVLLTESKNSSIDKYLNTYPLHLKREDIDVDKIVNDVYKRKDGMRGIDTIMYNLLQDKLNGKEKRRVKKRTNKL